MEAPEKIYLLPRQGGDYAPYWRTDDQDSFGIEYTRTDVIIEKTIKYIANHFLSSGMDNEINDFVNYMKGE